jgi:hypothetical protein
MFQNPNKDFTFRLKLIKKTIVNDMSDRASERNKEKNQNEVNDAS